MVREENQKNCLRGSWVNINMGNPWPILHKRNRMKKKMIVGLVMLLAFVAVPQIPSDANLRIQITSRSETGISGIVSNTQADILYEFQYKQNRTNWVSLGFSNGSEISNWMTFNFPYFPTNCLITNTSLINAKFIRVRSWIDSQGTGIADWWQLRYFGSVGIDPYGNPEGDGWNNMQKFQNNMDPFIWYPPPAPQLSVKYQRNTNDFSHGNAILTWQVFNGTVPDYFLIERANRTLRPMTNNPYFAQAPTNARFGVFGTNRPPYNSRYGALGTNRLPPGARLGAFGTNRPPPNAPFIVNGSNLPPNFHPMYGRPFGTPRGAQFVTEPFELAARVPGQAGVRNYSYVETNVDSFAQPIYRIQPHYSPPLHARLNRVDTESIRATISPVTSQQTTNGYALTALNPIPYARYLLLVRDKNDPQWRASGYFTTGTNRDPVYLQVDKKGMMTSVQSPIAMPGVKFLSDVVDPKFTVGWGEDSDGDGLPDIYEVLVTHTDPNNADTGDTGTPDGYKDLSGDGLSNLEKFHGRTDPTRKAQLPKEVELIKPNDIEIWQALLPKSDLHFDVTLEVRVAGSGNYQPIEQVPSMIHRILNSRQRNERRNFDLMVSWRYPDTNFDETMGGKITEGSYMATAMGMTPSIAKLAYLKNKTDIQVVETFRANLAARPPLSHKDMINYMASIDRAFRQDDIDQRELMEESMALQDNQSQDLYGKAIDQYGQPVIGADVTVQVNLGVGRGGTQTNRTDAAGLFQFNGFRGRSLNITLAKKGFQIEGHGLGSKGLNGPDTNPDNRAIYTMWKLKGPEPMIHKVYSNRNIKPDGRMYTVDFLKNEISEGTNVAGDFIVQFQRQPQSNPRENVDWSFMMTAMDGGFIGVTNDDYLNEAPKSGYKRLYTIERSSKDSTLTFYLKSRGGQTYGHFHIMQLYPGYRDKDLAGVQIEYYVNPSGSRNLEFDPAKQEEYKPNVPATVPAPPIVVPRKVRVASTNFSGQVVSWGSMVLPPVNPETRFTAVAAGGEHSLALKADGTVFAWGRNLSGESTVPEGLSNIVAIAAGGRSHTGFSLALKKDGTVVGWGNQTIVPIKQTMAPIGLSNVIAIAAGQEHSLALKSDGTIVNWGNYYQDQQVSLGLSNVVAISAGQEHSLALKSDGTVIAWGRNQHGQTNVPSGLSNVVSICSGAYFNLALKRDGSVVGWGIDVPNDLTNVTAITAGPWNAMALKSNGKLVVWGRAIFSATQLPTELTNIISFTSGGNDYGDHILVLTRDGKIVAWGNNNYGQSLSPGSLNDVTSLAAGIGHYLAIRSNGSIVAWGGEDHLGDGQALVPLGIDDVKAAAGGWWHSLVVRNDGTVVGWGYSFGYYSPPPGLSNVVSVTTALNHTLALKDNGSVVGWGDPHFPPAPSGLSNVVAVATGSSHNLALKKDGTVVEWSNKGEWDNKNVIQDGLPDGLKDIISIAVGGDYYGDHNLALRKDGTIVTWGSNNAGQTKQPLGLTNVIQVAAGANHSLALKKDGTIVAWGDNKGGQCNVPHNLKGVVKICAGGLSSAAIIISPAPAHHGNARLMLQWIWVSVLLLVLFLAVISYYVYRQRRILY